ncbi:MAG TPA: amino acid permease [Isosphaeraceae bacterium]|nr:amino acid permease [Isosphaeraceae bacterium]
MPNTERDDEDLARFGYRRRLNRTLGGFSSFAAGFSYLSILTGLPQLYYLGFGAGGPAFFWAWPLIFLGQFLVALCFAELAAEFPLSGGVYQWARRVGSDSVGWLAGWVYLASAVITLASVAVAPQSTLPQISSIFQIIGDAGNRLDSARNAVLLGCVLIAFSTIINAIGVKLLARINNVGVFAELVGAIVLLVLLNFRSVRGLGVVFDTQSRGVGHSLGYLGAFLAAALTPSFVMYGFDTAGSLAEETDNPRRRAPRAILGSLASVGLVGALLILGALRSSPDLADPALGRISGGMPYVIKSVLGDAVGTMLLWFVAVAVVVCTLTVQAAAVRLVFSMARDNNLPFSDLLAKVSITTKTPIWPSVLLGLAAAVLLVANANAPELIETMVSVAIVWANLAYLLVTAPMLVRRLRRKGQSTSRAGFHGFSMGRWGLPVNLLAVVWGLFVILNIGWPRPEIYGAEIPGRYVAPLATGAMVVLGILYYHLFQRRKTGILDDHRSE